MRTSQAVQARLRRCATLLVGVAFWTGMLTAGAPARADTDSPTLAKYAQPVDKAVIRALDFLKANQEPDGSFKSPMKKSTAVASLCVMAFLAKGCTPGTGPYGETINRGIDFVLGEQVPETGLLVSPSAGAHGPMYSHTISTLMLSEVSGMVSPERQKKIDVVLPKALKLILSAQKVRKPANQQGGWRYQAASPDSDLSCTGWAIMSLRSSRNNGAGVPNEGIEQGIRFVMNCRMSDGGFAYQPGGGSGLARTGTGLLCLELCGRHRDEAAIAAGKWILANLPKQFGQDFFYYALYYCSQGMFQLGGNEWETWATHMYEMMLKFQLPHGSWPQGGGNEAVAGPCYATAMGVLAMSVTYRQLPIYQR